MIVKVAAVLGSALMSLMLVAGVAAADEYDIDADIDNDANSEADGGDCHYGDFTIFLAPPSCDTESSAGAGQQPQQRELERVIATVRPLPPIAR